MPGTALAQQHKLIECVLYFQIFRMSFVRHRQIINYAYTNELNDWTCEWFDFICAKRKYGSVSALRTHMHLIKPRKRDTLKWKPNKLFCARNERRNFESTLFDCWHSVCASIVAFQCSAETFTYCSHHFRMIGDHTSTAQYTLPPSCTQPSKFAFQMSCVQCTRVCLCLYISLLCWMLSSYSTFRSPRTSTRERCFCLYGFFCAWWLSVLPKRKH